MNHETRDFPKGILVFTYLHGSNLAPGLQTRAKPVLNSYPALVSQSHRAHCLPICSQWWRCLPGERQTLDSKKGIYEDPTCTTLSL